MSTRTAILALEVTSDARSAAAQVDDLSASYKDLDRAAEKAAQVSAKVADQHAAVADATDNLASKSGQATGALGALSSGFELVGLEKYAGALQSASMATDFMSGVGDGLNLVMELQAVKNARATATLVAQKVALVATSAATKAAAAGQWLLNAAMSANPVGLIIAAVALLVAGFVVLFNKSETVRTVITAVGAAGKAAIGAVVDAVSALVGWVGARLPAAWETLKNVAVGVLKLITLPTRTLISVIMTVVSWVSDRLPGAFNSAKAKAANAIDGIRNAFDSIRDKVSTVRDWITEKIGAAFESIKGKAAAVKDALLAPFNAVKGVIQDIIDLIGKIKIPKLPSLPGWVPGADGRMATGATPLTPAADPYAAAPVTQVNITIQGAVDPASTARQIIDLLNRYNVQLGVTS